MRNGFLSAAAAALLVLTGCSAEISDSRTDSPAVVDENGIYVADGYAARVDYPLNESCVDYAASRFGYLYEEYLDGNCGDIFVTIVPDKGFFLAEENGCPAIDYDELALMLTGGMEYAEYIDIYPLLELSDYYRTDMHWRQESITDIARYIAEKMGVTLTAEYTETALSEPFYGNYYRQSEIDVEADTLIYLENEILSECTVLDGETDTFTSVYNLELSAGDDPYGIFLSGSKSLLTIENPNASSGKKLVIFRDSFASSIAPLFAEAYSEIILVDIRYIAPQLLGRFVTFSGQDVLFMYSTPVINNSLTLK